MDLKSTCDSKMHYIVFTTTINDNFGIHDFYPWVKPTLLPTFTQFYPTGFTQWVKRTMPTLSIVLGMTNRAPSRVLPPRDGSIMAV